MRRHRCGAIHLFVRFRYLQLERDPKTLGSYHHKGVENFSSHFSSLTLSIQGFSLLEAGAVRKSNVVNVLFKNTMDLVIATLLYYVLGYGFAFGRDNGNGFIGTTFFALSDGPNYVEFFFQLSFCATSSTIISGGAAGRCSMTAYALISVLMSGFLYPVVTHWVWSTSGWISAFNPNRSPDLANGFIDFAGSSVVHLTGGIASLMASITLGARLDRKTKFDAGEYAGLAGHSMTLQQIGTVILLFGWFGFNPGSTLAAANGAIIISARVATTTIISASSATATGLLLSYAFDKPHVLNLSRCLNSLIAGLVVITSGCATVYPWGALVIGIIGAAVYYTASLVVARCKVDDPLDAFAVHGAAGAAGTLMTGLLSYPELIAEVYNNPTVTAYGGWIPGGGGTQFAVQILGVVVIATWSGAISLALFLSLRLLKRLRVSEEDERRGLDLSKHGGLAYPQDASVNELHAMLLAIRKENTGADFSTAVDYELSSVPLK